MPTRRRRRTLDWSKGRRCNVPPRRARHSSPSASGAMPAPPQVLVEKAFDHVMTRQFIALAAFLVPATQCAPRVWYRWALQPEPLGGVFAEQVAVADVAADDGDAAMPALVHDGAFGFAGSGCRGGETGAQAVAGKSRWIVTEPDDIALHHEGHPFGREALFENLAVTVHHPEQRAR